MPATSGAPPANTQPSAEVTSNCSHQHPMSHLLQVSCSVWEVGISMGTHLTRSSWPCPLHPHPSGPACLQSAVRARPLAEWALSNPLRRGSCPWATYPHLSPALHHAVMLPNHCPPGSELSGPLLLLGHLCKTEVELKVSAP